MNINRQNVKFLISAAREDQYPKTNFPEIALVGRSNVGKSSFVNSLFNHKKLARISNRPGKTQQLNYYEVDEKFYVVDVPGYGYAKISKQQRQNWEKQLGSYLQNRESLDLILLLVDFRHEPTTLDKQMMLFISALEIPYFIIGTKSDKVKRGSWNKHLSQIKKALDLETVDQILPYSSQTHDGREEIWEIIQEVMEES